MTEYRFGGPIFIGGCPRSGTTMLGAMLANAPGCVTTPESHFKHALIARCAEKPLTREQLMKFLAQSNEIAFWELPLKELALWVNNYPNEITLDHVPALLNEIVYRYDQRAGTRLAQPASSPHLLRWVDHTPMNIEAFETLLGLYPDAQLIHIVRDPRAVAASVFGLPWGPNDALAFGSWWPHYVNAGLSLQNALPDRVLLIHYEDLLKDPQFTLKKTCQFLALQFSSDLVCGQRYRSPQHSLSQHALVGKPPAAERADAWQQELRARDQAHIESVCGPLMQKLGYAITPPFIASARGSTLMWYLSIIYKRARGSLRRKALRRERFALAQQIRSRQPQGGIGGPSDGGSSD